MGPLNAAAVPWPSTKPEPSGFGPPPPASVVTAPAGAIFRITLLRVSADVDIAGGVERHAHGHVERSRRALAVQEAGTIRIRTAAASQGRHRAGRRDHPDHAVEHVRHIDVARGVERHPDGEGERRRRALAIHIARAIRIRTAAAGQGRHRAGGRDQPDQAVLRVRHIDVAGAVDRQAHGLVEGRTGGRAIVGAGAHLDVRRAGIGGDRPADPDPGVPGVIFRILLLPESATKTLPERSTATP